MWPRVLYAQPTQTYALAFARAHMIAYTHTRPHNRTLTRSYAPAPLHTRMSVRTLNRSRVFTRLPTCISTHVSPHTHTLAHRHDRMPPCGAQHDGARGRAAGRREMRGELHLTERRGSLFQTDPQERTKPSEASLDDTPSPRTHTHAHRDRHKDRRAPAESTEQRERDVAI